MEREVKRWKVDKGKDRKVRKWEVGKMGGWKGIRKVKG
jgi:hypothetical protein